MVSIIVAIISLVGSCIAIYSNFIKDLLTSKKLSIRKDWINSIFPFTKNIVPDFFLTTI